MAERRAVTNWGHPRRSTLGDVAKRRVQGHCIGRLGKVSSMLNVKRRGREEGCGRPGASSTLNVG